MRHCCGIRSSSPLSWRGGAAGGGGGGGLMTRTITIVLLIGAVTWIPWQWHDYSSTSEGGTVQTKETKAASAATSPTLITSHSNPSMSPPLQTWHKYLAQHGTTALRRDTADQARQRQFLVAPYWCPDRAGNVLHNLWNSITWAILLNRTLLLHWVDDNPPGNTRQKCPLYPPHAQVPTWEQWHGRLDVSPTTTTTTTTVPSIPLQANRIKFDETLTAIWVPQIPDVYPHNNNNNQDGVGFLYRNDWNQHALTYREYLQAWLYPSVERQEIAMNMLGWGIPFWYGLLLRQTFFDWWTTKTNTRRVPTRVTQGKVGNSNATTNINSANSISIAVHSRHVAPADDGSYVPEEVQCLTRLLANYTTTTNDGTTCTVALLSDRRATLAALTTFLHQHYPACRVVTTRHEDDTADTTRIAEHGPFAGRGFLNDLVMATTTATEHPVTALVGDWHRSSFHLLYEAVVYESFRHKLHGNALPALGETLEIPVCALSPRTPGGYSYGPGTPTFVRNPAKFPPLEPVQVLDDYRREQTTLSSSRSSFLVVTCPRDESSYANFLAAFVVAVLSQRQLVWTGQESCHGAVLPDWLLSVENVTTLPEDWNATALMELTQPNAHEYAVTTLSEPTLERMVQKFRRGDLLRPNQGGGKRSIAQSLFAHGPAFLFGFLATQVWPTMPPRGKVPTLTAQWTVGMDVRQWMQSHGESGRGSSSSSSIGAASRACMHQALENRTVTDTCQIVLVQETKEWTELSTYLESHFNCSVLIVTTRVVDSEPVLATVGQVRHGWIGAAEPDAMEWRLRERIEWERVQATWRLGRFPIQVPPFVDCTLK